MLPQALKLKYSLSTNLAQGSKKYRGSERGKVGAASTQISETFDISTQNKLNPYVLLACEKILQNQVSLHVFDGLTFQIGYY